MRLCKRAGTRASGAAAPSPVYLRELERGATATEPARSLRDVDFSSPTDLVDRWQHSAAFSLTVADFTSPKFCIVLGRTCEA